ncbi:hypothetical protein BDD12DRAFT_865737 [Trichophaea hybrida]|nr:hypothetical protein BDD12DRAFT_865737 [Trichophaea hybrida]
MWLLLLILFLKFGMLTAVLAQVGSHCVTGIALPPVDANFFRCCFGRCARERGRKWLVLDDWVAGEIREGLVFYI